MRARRSDDKWQACQSRRHDDAGDAADFGKFLIAETDKWAKVIHEANIKLMD